MNQYSLLAFQGLNESILGRDVLHVLFFVFIFVTYEMMQYMSVILQDEINAWK